MNTLVRHSNTLGMGALALTTTYNTSNSNCQIVANIHITNKITNTSVEVPNTSIASAVAAISQLSRHPTQRMSVEGGSMVRIATRL
jgi:hypothetical protein